MKIVLLLGRLLSGIIAIVSGIITLVFNSVSYTLFDQMSTVQKYFCIGLIIFVGFILVSSTIYDTIISSYKSQHTYRLKYQSKKFISFFKKWYNKPGTLSIICDDLDWTKTNNSDLIYNQLIKKSQEKKLNLYLGSGHNSNIVRSLKNAGANVFTAPDNIIQNYTFSCLSVMGNTASRIIVRTKHNDQGDFVIFDEINSTYVTELLNAMLTTKKG